MQMVSAAMKLKDTPWKKSYDKPRQHIIKQRHYFADKGSSSKAMVFPVVMYGYEIGPYKRLSTEELILLNCDLKKTLESSLDSKKIQPVHPRGNQS